MSATETPTPAPSAEDAFAAAVQDLAAGMQAPEGAPPAAETPAAPPETPPAPAEGDQETPPTPEPEKPPAVDWEARFRDFERKVENDRRADIGRLNAEREARAAAERRVAEIAAQKDAEYDRIFEQARDQALAGGDTARAEQLQRTLDERAASRQLADERTRREAAEGERDAFRQQFTAAQAAQMAARTPGVMAGATPHALGDALRDVAGLEQADTPALEKRALAWLNRPAVQQRMATIIPVPHDPQAGVNNPRFQDLIDDFQSHVYSHAEAIVEQKRAAAAAARDTLAPKVAMEGGGPGGAAPRQIRTMDDVTADDWQKALDRG
jgi:hypothetical protein